MISNADQVVETFQTATEENQLSSLRENQLVTLPEQGEVWMTGDLHDHRRNFEKLVKAADLANNPQRHLILHELIHGDRFDSDGADSSWWMLYQAAELKCNFASQVHFLLANHDLAQIHGEGIAKGGTSVCEAFNAGVRKQFREDTTSVTIAITEFLLSLPLAVRTPSGLFFCHSVPHDDHIATFDFTIFNRPLSGPDYKRRAGPVYQLIWGRNVTPAAVSVFAEKVGARLVVTGHQPQDTGYGVNGEQHLILASDHNQGVFLPLDLSARYDMAGLVGRLRKYAALQV